MFLLRINEQLVYYVTDFWLCKQSVQLKTLSILEKLTQKLVAQHKIVTDVVRNIVFKSETLYVEYHISAVWL